MDGKNVKLTPIDKIDYMIKSLQIAKEEIEYAQLWNQQKAEQSDNFYYYSGYGSNHRFPNGTVVRESLKMVSRIANITAKEITLSQYCDKVFIGDKSNE